MISQIAGTILKIQAPFDTSVLGITVFRKSKFVIFVGLSFDLAPLPESCTIVSLRFPLRPCQTCDTDLLSTQLSSLVDEILTHVADVNDFTIRVIYAAFHNHPTL